MNRRLTRSEAQSYRRRWQRVEAREIEELRSTSLQTRWQQFNTLLNWARRFGWTEALSQGESEVRQRWGRIRKAMGA